MGFLGYVQCDDCDRFVYIKKPTDIVIWFHPDDPRPLCEVTCPSCNKLVASRIDFDHMANFRRRGVTIRDFNDKFEALSEQMIEEWDIDSELDAFAFS